MKIRRMLSSDIDNVIKYENEYLGSTLGKDYFKRLIDDKYSCFLVLEDNDILIGYISSTLDTYAEILNFFVVKENRGRGYGKELLESVISAAKENKCQSIYLEVNSNNIQAISLYKSCGFEINHIRKNYYKDADAYAMIKEL
ncbi:MAG: ribosomal protein S18-alanine N-acetyltransferase [Acholeplasmatales bacterium]|nr:ribosomal protein S18-alanine N-acetyltransferase [Acholeplasmatales bacterium]